MDTPNDISIRSFDFDEVFNVLKGPTWVRRSRFRGPTLRARKSGLINGDVIEALKEQTHVIAWIQCDASMLDLIDRALTEFGPFDSLTIAIPIIGARHLRRLLEWREQGRVGKIEIMRDSCSAGRRGARKLEGQLNLFASMKNRVRAFSLVKGVSDGGPSASELNAGVGIFVTASCSMTVNRDYSDLVIASREVASAVDFREWVRMEIVEPKCLTERD